MSMEFENTAEFEELEQDVDEEIDGAEEEEKDEKKTEEAEKVNIFKRGWRGLKNLVNKGRKNPVVTGVVGLVAGAGAGVAGKMLYDHFTSDEDEADEELPTLQDYEEQSEEDYGPTEEEYEE